MRIVKYKVKNDDNSRTKLVKEVTVNYKTIDIIDCSLAVYLLARDVLDLCDMSEEYVYLVTLNNRKKITGVFEVSHGTNNCSIVSPQSIFNRVLMIGSSAFILIHNHPSDFLNPSNEDLEITKKIFEGAELLELQFLDHVIIGKNDYYSFLDSGILH